MPYRIVLFSFFLFFFHILNCHAVNNIKNTKAELCNLSTDDISNKLALIKANRNFVLSLSYCEKSNRQLISGIIDSDYRYFYHAAESIKDDETFIKHFIIKNPDILQYVSRRLKDSEFFMFSTVKLYSDVLRYASPRLLDNKIFMSKMIKKNYKNFIYASRRLQDDRDTVLLAVMGSGAMLEFASKVMRSDKEIVKEAAKSYTPAIFFATKTVQKDEQIEEIVKSIDYSFLDGFSFFLKENYAGLPVGPQGIRGYRIVNQGKFFPQEQIIYRPYFVKWKDTSKISGNKIVKGHKLIHDISKYGGWKLNLKEYPVLIEQIEKIFTDNAVDSNTINSLTITSLWEVWFEPKVLAFNLYLLRDVKDQYLDIDLSNITSLTVIAKKDKAEKDSWSITIVDAMFDIDIEVDIRFKSGHKKYIIWDLYEYSNKDSNPKVLFKIEGKDKESFELFVEQPNGKYISFYKGGGYNIDNY